MVATSGGTADLAPEPHTTSGLPTHLVVLDVLLLQPVLQDLDLLLQRLRLLLGAENAAHGAAGGAQLVGQLLQLLLQHEHLAPLQLDLQGAVC